MAEASNVSSSNSKLPQQKVEKLLRENSDRASIESVGGKKRSECWKQFGFPKVDEIVYEDLAACYKCKRVYKYCSGKGNAQLNKHTCNTTKLAKGQTTLKFFSAVQDTPQIKLSKAEEEALQTDAIDAAALDFSPLSSYGKESIKQLLKTAARLGAKYGGHLDLTQHIAHRTSLTRNYLPKRHEQIRKNILDVLNADPFCTTTDLWKEKFTGKSYMSVTLHHVSPDWTLRNFIWSTAEYNLDDHTAANIGKFYLENVPDAPFRLVATDNTNTMPAAFRDLIKDDQIGCIAHISSLIAKACVTSEEAIEVKANIEAAKRLVEHVKRADLQSRLTKTLKQTLSTRFYTYREMIGSVVEGWDELEKLLDARNELNYLQDINKILLMQTSRVLKPLHSCGLELEQDKKPTLHRVLFWHAKLKLAFCENEQDLAAIKKMKAIGRKAIETKLMKRLGIYHDVAATMDPRVREIEDETKRNLVYHKISYLYEKITGHQLEICQSSDDDIGDEVNLSSLLFVVQFEGLTTLLLFIFSF